MKRCHFVVFREHPCKVLSYGWSPHGEGPEVVDGQRLAEGERLVWLGQQRWNQLVASQEPSKLVATWFKLPYQKYLPSDDDLSNVHVVELIAGDDCGFDQPCRFGYRVEAHAVYCHNRHWVDVPTKCRRTSCTGGEVKDEDCPGFEARRVSVRH